MYQYRTDYILQKEHELEEATSEIKRLRAKAARDEAEKARYQVKYDDLLQSLEFQVVEVREQLDKLKNDSEDAWENLKDNLEIATDNLRESLRTLGSRISNR